MSKSKKTTDRIQKEDILQAVLIADNFDDVFDGVCGANSPVLLPLVNTTLIDYALECLGRSGIQETILFSCSHADVIKGHINKCKWKLPGSSMNVNVIISERCLSLGDCMRDLDNKALLKGDFVLISAFTVSNLELLPILDYHKNKFKNDKGTAMTIITQDVGATLTKSSETIIAVDDVTDQLLFHLKPGESPKKVQIPLEHFMEHPKLTVLSKLRDTGISICSPSVPLLFSDNFDFQTKDDFIRGLLLNEEILGSHIYCYQLKHEGYGATVSDWATYQRISMDVIHRWTFPLVPDQPINLDSPYAFLRTCVYKQGNIQLSKNSELKMDIVIAQGSQIGQNTKLLRAVIGRNCIISDNCIIEDCFIFDNCVIEENCNMKLSVLGKNVKIGKNSTIKQCIIGEHVRLHDNSNQDDESIVSKPDGENTEKINENAFLLIKPSSDEESEDGVVVLTPARLRDPDIELESDDDFDQSTLSDQDMSYTQSVEHDDTTLFYNEVLDSLQRGYEEKLNCENLVLEINSSRYAYNVTLSEVNQLTVKAVLGLSSRCQTSIKALLLYFLPLFKNYIKNNDAMNDCLESFEEMEEELGSDITKSLHFLYDNDILSEEAIIRWHKELKDSSPIKNKIMPLIKWLEEAAEESSSEESD